MPANITHERGSSDDSNSDTERPHKKHKAVSPSSSTRELDEEQESNTPAVQDITGIALDEVDQATDGAALRSAFDFSPAKPPAAYASSRLGPGPLGHAPPSAAASRRWSIRDRLDSREELPDSFTNYRTDYAMRIDTFEETGSLLWLQAECLEEGVRKVDSTWWSRGSTFGHTNIDTSGRDQGQERILGNCGPWEDPDPAELAVDEQSLAEPRNRLKHSHLGLSRYARETTISGPHYDVVHWDFFHEQTDRPRSLTRTQLQGDDSDDEMEELGGWMIYDRHVFRSTLSVPVKPLEPQDSCDEVLDCVGRRYLDIRRGDELNLTITMDEEVPAQEDQDYDWSIRGFHLAPLDLSYDKVASPPGHRFSVIAVNEGSGFCWLGKLDGTVEFLDVLGWIEANYLSCPGLRDDSMGHDVFCPCNVGPIEPVEIIDADKDRGPVTNLLAVGQREVVAAFSDGSIRLLEADRSRVISKTRKYVGHVNDGSHAAVEMAVHATSRLMAARGTDGQVRIWHLDSRYPLNTAWHRPRTYPYLDLDLISKKSPPPPQQQQQPQQQTTKVTNAPESTAAAAVSGAQRESQDEEATKAEGSQAATATAETEGDETWDRLATDDVDATSFVFVEDARLAGMRVKPFCGMAWTHTSWLADRDGQWEMARDFDTAGRPKVVTAGLLPSLVCCSDRHRGTTFLYFEPERMVGIEDSEVEEGQQLAGEAAAEAAAVSYEGAEAFH